MCRFSSGRSFGAMLAFRRKTCIPSVDGAAPHTNARENVYWHLCSIRSKGALDSCGVALPFLHRSVLICVRAIRARGC